VNGDLDGAIGERTQNFQDLVWGRRGDRFELAVELEIPEKRRQKIAKPSYSTVRYEVAIGQGGNIGELSILAEKVLLKEGESNPVEDQRSLFPVEPTAPETIISSIRIKKTKTVINKVVGAMTITTTKPARGGTTLSNWGLVDQR